jgi:hypothetical protein
VFLMIVTIDGVVFSVSKSNALVFIMDTACVL